ncbi:hypothetical protein G3580_00840 [Nitrogeniibacter mangrovi]|uniref:Uncharacterized protein n=1 Tax=Nitrogeniibacter mangrovi TaxID=2016596 RepID=A0A6C1AY67_9RHOO|nr:hypothetical protein [Nitrogeniibacter mangrovi]QID16296.1 hypothetical protein G3580_00840 [Nitrogeniibacter mangrovi]
MRTVLLSLALACSMAACAQTPVAPVSAPWFNAREFAGLVSTPAPDQPARLDFTLDAASGRALRFTDCAQANATSGDDIVPAEYSVFQLLKLHCAAYERYRAAVGARQSNLPDTLDEAFIAQLPEAILPENGSGPSMVRIGDSPRVERIAKSGGGRWEIQTRDEQVIVTRFAQGDFNHDGVDDMLLRVGWRYLDALDGGGMMMVEITRRVPGGAIEVVSRIRP